MREKKFIFFWVVEGLKGSMYLSWFLESKLDFIGYDSFLVIYFKIYNMFL